MLGFELFLSKLDELTLEKRRSVVKRILDFKEVKLYTLENEDGNVVFRVFDGKKYYKINIIFLDITEKNWVIVNRTDISVICDVYINNFVYDDSFFSYFIKLLLENDVSYFELFLQVFEWILFLVVNYLLEDSILTLLLILNLIKKKSFFCMWLLLVMLIVFLLYLNIFVHL